MANVLEGAIFTEGDVGVTAYAPILDFATCGRDRKDAEAMLQEGAAIFLEEIRKKARDDRESECPAL